jgi:hypothetical protein
MTFGVIILAYLTDSLPGSFLSDVDIVVIKTLRQSRVASFLCGLGNHTLALLRYVSRMLQKCFCINISNSEPSSWSREQKVEALTRFILTLSDQQIVTGLAILIGAMANICRLSSYEFGVVVSLAWFSSATHIATLDVLQEYFRRQYILYICRAIAMVILLGCLIFGLIIGIWTNLVPGATPLACVNWTLKGRIDSKVYPDVPYAWSDYAFNILPNVVAVFYLLIAYSDRILNLHRTSRVDTKGYSPLWWLFWYSYLTLRVPLCRMSSSDRSKLARNALSQYDKDRRGRAMSLLKNNAIIFRVFACYQEYSTSFLSRIAAMCFAFSYGAAGVASWRWYDSPPIEAGDERMDFGQIVPLLLLAIPVLAAAESFSGEPFLLHSSLPLVDR